MAASTAGRSLSKSAIRYFSDDFADLFALKGRDSHCHFYRLCLTYFFSSDAVKYEGAASHEAQAETQCLLLKLTS